MREVMSVQKGNRRNERIKYFIAFVMVLLIEMLIAVFVNDKFIRPYVGDILVVVLIYCAIRSIILYKSRLMPFYIFIFAAGIECLQYFSLLELLGLQVSTFWRIVIGSTFDIKDILCYGVGCISLALYEWVHYKGNL
jgi:hypothetical protein